MPKVRLGVALLVPAPLRAEIDGVRRALGDGALGRIPAHLTLVPPVNVNEERLGEAMRVVREGAAQHRPFEVRLGPPTTFLPDNPVVFLPVTAGSDDLVLLRESIFREPLSRPLTWPFVPHVTLADECDEERIQSAVSALADLIVECSFDHVHVLQEQPGRIWEPIAAVPLAAPAVVGRGSLPLSLEVLESADQAEVSSILTAEWGRHNEMLGLHERRRLMIVARRHDEVVGAAQGWTSGPLAFLEGLLVVAAHRGEGIGSHLVSRFESAAAERGCERVVLETFSGTHAVDWYLTRGWNQIAALPNWSAGRDNLFLERWL